MLVASLARLAAFNGSLRSLAIFAVFVESDETVALKNRL